MTSLWRDSLEEVVSEEQPKPLKLSGQQQALYEALFEKDQRLAIMYLGALIALDHTGNPDRLALAAHDLRELMDNVPKFVDVQIKAQKESLTAKVRELEDRWQATLRNTECYESQTWSGQIDGPLLKLLKTLHAFLEWLAEHHPRRKAEIAATLRRLDVSGRTLPVRLEELNVQIWDEMRSFFLGVCHHGKTNTTEEEFRKWVDTLERFILDRLHPRTFADLETIDEIIREGERDA